LHRPETERPIAHCSAMILSGFLLGVLAAFAIGDMRTTR